MQEILKQLVGLQSLKVRQLREVFELVGFETRNKYSIETDNGAPFLFAAEQQKGALGFLFRQSLGHWRSFEIHIFDSSRRPIAIAKHPFRFFFQRLEIYSIDGACLGVVEKKFSILAKRFEVTDRSGKVLFTVNSPLLKLWTFPFLRGDEEFAVIKKRWSGLLHEGFLDADRFVVEFTSPRLSAEERFLITAAGIFIDLQYFERKAR